MDPAGATSLEAVGGTVAATAGGKAGHAKKGRKACLRVYVRGRLVREVAVPAEEVDAILSRSFSRPDKRRLIHLPGGGARMGENVAHGHRSYDLMTALQLGIRYSLGKITHEAAPRELGESDYELEVRQRFPRCGSGVTPLHSGEDFVWKDYAPMVFRKLRELFGNDASSYMLSLCSAAALRQLNSPGKSGSVFFVSHDDHFFVKTLSASELHLLLAMLPAYHRHMAIHPHTLLTKFYGLHRITTSSGKKVHFVVMGNLFRTGLQLHRKYDLKGSVLGRTAGGGPEGVKDDPSIIYKDLDLNMTFNLEGGWHERLMSQLKADCSLLESASVMDYSLILGVHFRDKQPSNHIAATVNTATASSSAATANMSAAAAAGNGVLEPSPAASALARSETTMLSPRPRNFGADIEEGSAASAVGAAAKAAERIARLRLPEQQAEDLLQLAKARLHSADASRHAVMEFQPRNAEQLALCMGQSHVRLGENMPATATTAGGHQSQECVLYFGVIDFLQPYNAAKRMEHALKSIVHDSHSLSVTHPHAYAQRFQAAMKHTFL